MSVMKSNLLQPLFSSAAGGAPSHYLISISGILPFSINFWVLTITLAWAANYPRQALPLRRLSSERRGWQSAQSVPLWPHAPGS